MSDVLDLKLTVFPLSSFLAYWLETTQRVEFCILQNNAVNIYEEYFDGLEPAPIVDRSHSRTMFVYKDVETPTVMFVLEPFLLINWN